jgi:predicted ester cyclase
MGVEENKRVVVRIVDEILNDGNLDSVEELVHPRYLDGYGGPSGREGYRDLVASVRAVFPDMHLAVEDLIGEGDKVVGRFTFRGTHSGEFLGISATGRRVEVPVMGLIQLRDGQMIGRWNVSDWLDTLEELRT